MCSHTLGELDAERGTGGNRVYYLAVPPTALAPLAEQLGRRRRDRAQALDRA